ncbi:CocE/NonD family hydrolase [Actinoplanes sp. NPDC051346]|uniref:CocE/NonD family hydrolase n=1 Tax=Actinoplanes sp. NPDC051346 TaxID=3155048 RepID=UPI003426D78C
MRTPSDADEDGVPDRVAVDLVRPRTAPGVKVPVVMDASPYYSCCGRGNESELKEYDANGVISKAVVDWLNGRATVEVDLARSTLVLPVAGPATLTPSSSAPSTAHGLTARVRPGHKLP